MFSIVRPLIFSTKIVFIIQTQTQIIYRYIIKVLLYIKEPSQLGSLRITIISKRLRESLFFWYHFIQTHNLNIYTR